MEVFQVALDTEIGLLCTLSVWRRALSKDWIFLQMVYGTDNELEYIFSLWQSTGQAVGFFQCVTLSFNFTHTYSLAMGTVQGSDVFQV